MRIARFGDTYAGGYVFSTSLMDDAWQSTRPPITQPASGASGVFDFYGSDNYPIAPLIAKKKFAIRGTSSADLEDSLLTLRAATIAAPRTKLWFQDRDNSTNYWMWAKCTRLSAPDKYQEKGRWLKPVDIEFYCPEGVWYGATEQDDSQLISPGGDNAFLAPNGTVKSGCEINCIPNTFSCTNLVVTVNGSDTTFTFSDTITNATLWTMDTSLYTVVNNSVDAYSGLSVTGGPRWLELDQNSGASIQLNINYTAGGGDMTFQVKWWDTYVF